MPSRSYIDICKNISSRNIVAATTWHSASHSRGGHAAGIRLSTRSEPQSGCAARSTSSPAHSRASASSRNEPEAGACSHWMAAFTRPSALGSHSPAPHG